MSDPPPSSHEPPPAAGEPLAARGLLLVVRVAIALSLILGAVGVLVAKSTGEVRPGFVEGVVGIFLTTAIYAFYAALLTVPLTWIPRPRLLLGPVAALLAAPLGFHVLGVSVRGVVGSHVTHSGWLYFTNAQGGIMTELGNRFLLELVLLASGFLVFVGGWFYVLHRAFRERTSPAHFVRSRDARLTAGMAIGAVAFWILPVPEHFTRGVAQTEPAFALAASLVRTKLSTTTAVRPRTGLVGIALESAPLTAIDDWNRTARPWRKPNVVLVVIEAIAVSHTTMHGYARETTPHFQALSDGGLYAERAYATATHSNYTQMAILSSLFPLRGSSLDMYVKLDYPRVLLNDALFMLGYDTATITSQDETWQGMLRFEETGVPTYFHHSPDHEGEHLDIGTEKVVPDELTIEHALSWIDRPRDNPFAVYINLQSTHFPYVVPETFAKPYLPDEPQGTFNFVAWDDADHDRVINRYDNALSYVDAQIGRLVDGLRERDLLDDTIVVITADHGELFGEHGLVTHARSLHEGEVRVPLVFHYPEGLGKERLVRPMSTLDIAPTVLGLLGVPPHPAMQGRDALDEDPEPRSALFMNIQGWKPLMGLLCYPWKLVHDPDTLKTYLFDIERDPGEVSDKSGSEPAVLNSLREVLFSQVAAQLEYHEGTSELRRTQVAPRLLPCPSFPR